MRHDPHTDPYRLFLVRVTRRLRRIRILRRAARSAYRLLTIKPKPWYRHMLHQHGYEGLVVLYGKPPTGTHMEEWIELVESDARLDHKGP